jgi:uncharacterized membrane protein
MTYYEEYFFEAGPDKELAVIEELGAPSSVASKIIGEFALSETAPAASATSSAKTFWIALIALLASPIAFPLAIAAVAIIFSLLIVMLVVPFAFGVVGLALCVAGFVAFFTGLWALFIHFPTGIFQTGYALVAAATGILLTIGAIKAYELVFKGLSKVVGTLLVRKAA